MSLDILSRMKTVGSGSVTVSLACTQPKCRADKGILEITSDDVVFRFLCNHGQSSHWQGISMKRTLGRAIQKDAGFLPRLIETLSV